MIKVKLTDYTNVKNDGYWHKIEIPITKSLLTAKVKYPLAWGSLPGSENADWRRGDTFYLDRIYYTK